MCRIQVFIAVAMLCVTACAGAQQPGTPDSAQSGTALPHNNTSHTKPKVRAITAFVRLDRANYQQQIADTLVVLREAKKQFEAAGYGVETVRITTQPLAQLVNGMGDPEALAFLKTLDELSVKENFLPNVG